jgi:Asp-tRNA(Asn)/Glu-tRNA(Gln) amidotransferase A subunit family amidase
MPELILSASLSIRGPKPREGNPVSTLNTSITNLTGQPCVVVPHGFNEKGLPTSLTFVGRVFGEATMLAAALAFQEATDFHLKHPKL